MSCRVDAGKGTILSTDSGDKDFSINNFGGEAPKVVLMFPSEQDVDGRSNDAKWGMGVLTDDAKYFMGGRMQNNVASSNTQSIHTGTECLAAINSSSTAIAWSATGAATPMSADKFTLDINNAPGSDKDFGYLAIGGSDVEVDVGSFSLETDAQQTISGLPFEPEALILMTVRMDENIEATTNYSNDVRLSIGFSDGTTEFNSCMSSNHSSNPTLCWKTTRSDSILTAQAFSDGSPNGKASLNSFTSDGFILDHTDTWAGTYRVVYIALRGVNFKTGSTTHQTSTGNFDVTGVGFKGQALMMIQGGNMTAYDTVKADAVMFGGFATSASARWTSGCTDDSGITPSETQTVNDDDKCLVRYGAHSTTIIAEIDFVSWNSDGFTLDQVDSNNTTHVIQYLVIGGVVDDEHAVCRGIRRGVMMGVL